MREREDRDIGTVVDFLSAPGRENNRNSVFHEDKKTIKIKKKKM